MMKQYLIILIACMLSLHSVAQQYGAFKDHRDGKVYKTVKIGNQVWMAENLNVSKFRNGDPIPEAKSDEEWEKAGRNKQPVWCYYDNEPINGKKYGKLYNWYAVIDPRGLAPVGYHIPSETEWTILTDYLGGGEDAEAKMKSKQGWALVECKGTNSSGFSGVPGGLRSFGGIFQVIGEHGGWWGSTKSDAKCCAWVRVLSSGCSSSAGMRGYADKGEGFSVRCLRD